MKLTAKQVPAFIKAPLAQGVGALVYGPDEGQVHEFAAQITKAVVEDPNDPFAVVELTDEHIKAEPTRLSDELNAMSMLGGKRLVRLQSGSDKSGKLLAEIYAANPNPEAFLLVVAGELPPRAHMRQFFEKAKQLQALACYRDEGYALDKLIQQSFAEAGLRAEQGVVPYLSANLGSDRRMTRAQLEKMVLYAGDSKSLSLEEAMMLVGNHAELTLDDLSTALADGQWREVERILHKQLREGTQPIQILRSLQRYFQRLHLLKATMKQAGASADAVIGDCKPKIFFKQVPVLRRQLQAWDMTALERAQRLLVDAERAAKETGSAADASLQQLVFDVLAVFHRQRRARSNTAA